MCFKENLYRHSFKFSCCHLARSFDDWFGNRLGLTSNRLSVAGQL